MIVVWVVFGLVVLVGLAGLAALWILANCGYRTASSRHSAWSRMVSQLPPGSRLTGVEARNRTVVELSPTVDTFLESRGGR